VGSHRLAQSKDRFERAEVLAAALDPIIDICVRIGVNSTELESLVRVEFVRRLAETLPGNLRTGRGPSHEEIGLAAGLNRGEVQNILASGTKSAEMRMQKKARQHSKSERILTLWSKNTRYLSTSGLPLDLPLDLQPEGPSFSELVEKALPGKLPRTVLKELRRRGLVQLLPDEIVRYRKTTALPTELNTAALAYAAEQIRLLGNTLVQSMRDPADNAPKEFAAYVASEPIKVASDVLDISQPAMLARIASFIQGIEIEFGRGANKSRKSKAPSKTIGVSVYTWRKK
jgi:Family of unknown function (DUF6502)